MCGPGAARPKQKCRLSKAALAGIVLAGSCLSTPRRALRKPRKNRKSNPQVAEKADFPGLMHGNMWTYRPRTLAAESRHIVASPKSDTTSRAAALLFRTVWFRVASGFPGTGIPAKEGGFCLD